MVVALDRRTVLVSVLLAAAAMMILSNPVIMSFPSVCRSCFSNPS